MLSPDKVTQKKPGLDFARIIGILVVQLAVMIALSGVVIFYLNWSSNAAQAEFLASIKSSAPTHASRPVTPIQAVRGKTSCTRKV